MYKRLKARALSPNSEFIFTRKGEVIQGVVLEHFPNNLTLYRVSGSDEVNIIADTTTVSIDTKNTETTRFYKAKSQNYNF